MMKFIYPIVLTITILVSTTAVAQDREVEILSQNSYDLSGTGRTFLLNEAQRVNFFMIGELHGEREIPELLTSIWPTLYAKGYHHIAAEVSEWAAAKLEFPGKNDSLKVEGLWTNREAQMVHSVADKSNEKILWGCDMEEISLGEMIKESFEDTRRSDDLYASIFISLKIDSARAFRNSRLKAQLMREELMKRSFLKNYNKDPKSKVFLRFGRNHLHYGFDERGISTLGNFIAELSVSRNLTCFNVATFAAGGECELMGNRFNADERGDDPAFQFLSEKAKYNATVFDLRPLRLYLHTIAGGKRTDLQRRLLYWADSYDAIICYRSVTPR